MYAVHWQYQLQMQLEMFDNYAITVPKPQATDQAGPL
jgi:hypothetical protein